MKHVALLTVAGLLGVVCASAASPAGRDVAPCGLVPPPTSGSTSAPPAPVVTYPTPPTSNVTPTSATLQGAVDAGGDGAAVAFEYGTTPEYGTCSSTLSVSGAGSQFVDAPISGLVPGTTYHFRVDATSAAGTTLGQDETFRTTVQPVATARAASGVVVGGVRVGGLTRRAATRAVTAAYSAPLQFSFGGRHWKATPAQLGAHATIDAAIRHALTAKPGTRVAVRVSLSESRVGAYVSYLDRTFGRQAKAGSVRLVGRHAAVSPSVQGVAVASQAMRLSIDHALRTIPRPVLPLVVRRITPTSQGEKTVVIRLNSQTLTAYIDGKTVLTTPVTTGRPALPTPVGSYVIHYRASPYTFISPWPQGSPYYYPPTTVTWAMYFYDNDFLHDDPAQPNGTYGKGSNLGPYASHGCVHVPHDTMRFLYTWLPVGATVIVADS